MSHIAANAHVWSAHTTDYFIYYIQIRGTYSQERMSKVRLDLLVKGQKKNTNDKKGWERYNEYTEDNKDLDNTWRKSGKSGRKQQSEY